MSYVQIFDAIHLYIVYMHDSTEGHAGDKNMPEAPSGRHAIVFGMSFSVCDASYYAHHRDSLELS